MPTLDWIGKKAVLNHHREVPYHLLKCDKSLSVGDPGSGNLLIQGDNLLALKALLPYYAGQVKCIYIDPPYNTGNENWIYNDAVNSPEIRNWLGKVVGAEAEDLSRHDKWLCMMYPRLALLREFLRDDGLFFLSINRHEYGTCRLLLDEIFGVRCHLATLVWKSRHFVDARPLNGVSEDHEYIMVYGKRLGARLRGKAKDYTKYKNPDMDPRGPWTSCSLLGKATQKQRPNLHYDFHDPVTGQVFQCPARTGWICAADTMEFNARDQRLLYPKKKDGRLRVKVYQRELKSEFMGFPSVITEWSTSDGTMELTRIFGDQLFSFPKPSGLIAALILQATDPDSIVLDSFAGSGTTGHATLRANFADGGQRRFILVELDESICGTITRTRLEKVVTAQVPLQYEKELLFAANLTITRLNDAPALLEQLREVEAANEEDYESFTREFFNGELRLYGIPRNDAPKDGLEKGFRYCTLASPLFDERGSVRDGVTFADLAAHIYFTETGEPIPKRAGKSPLLGIHNGRAIYLLFNGVLGDKRTIGGNVLTSLTLAALPKHDGSRIVYGEGCRLSLPRLKREGMTFKQVPYGIKVT